MAWLLDTTSPSRVAAEMGRTRDPAGIAALQALRESSTVGKSTFIPALERVAVIMAAKGGLVADITPGDCVELLDTCRQVFTSQTEANRHSPFFYQLLHTAGTFPPGAPATVRMISPLFAGQLSVEQLVDRHDLACRPVRDLLVDHLRERQPGIDYGTLLRLVINLDNLHARIAEAEREGWTGEAEGLKISLARANEKLAQANAAAARRTEAIHLGIPAYRDIAAATLTTGGPHGH